MTTAPALVIQNCPAESPGTIVDYLNTKSIPYILCHTYKGDKLPALDSIDRVISLGCPHSVLIFEEFDYLRNLFEYLKQVASAGKPYLGLCFGAQIMAKALGAEVRVNPVKEIGVYTVKLTEAGKESVLFSGFPDAIEVFQWHGDTFGIAPKANLLATADDCLNQAFGSDNSKIFGLQFHLEADPKEVPDWCDMYAGEMIEFGRTKKEVVDSYDKVASRARELNFRLLDNFFAIT